MSWSMVYAQIKAGDNQFTIDPASLIEIESTSKGFLPSRMTTVQRDLQTQWKLAHVIYNTTDSCLQVYNGTSWNCFAEGSDYPGIDSTIYSYDGTLTANRILSQLGYSLTLSAINGTDTAVLSNASSGQSLSLITNSSSSSLSNSSTGFNFSLTGSADLSINGNPGTSNQVLTSNGDNVAPSWQDPQNIYNSNGTLDADREVGLSTFDLIFLGSDTVAIDQSGRLGVGLRNPQQKLHISDDTESVALFTTPNTGSNANDGLYVGVLNSNSTAWLWNYENSNLYIGSNNDTTITILTNGQIRLDDYGIGTFDDASPARILAVQADGTVVETNANGLGTDDQTIDLLSIVNDTLNISLENDGQPAQTVDLSAYLDNTDDQTIDSFAISSNVLAISVEDDGQAPLTVDLSSYLDNTDDQTIDQLNIINDSLNISLENDGQPALKVDLSAYLDNTDDQKIDSFSLSTNTLVLSIENDGEAPQTVDLSSLDNANIYSDDDTLSSTRTVTMNGNNLTFDGTGTGDFIIQSDGSVGIGDLTPDARLDVEGGTVRLSDYGGGSYADTTSTYILGVESDGDVIEVNAVKNMRWFYAPPVTIDVSSTTVDDTLDLHQEYVDQFGSPSIVSTGAPSSIPYYDETELYYYVSYYDSSVLQNITIDATGKMVYDVVSVPADNYTVINVIFVIK